MERDIYLARASSFFQMFLLLLKELYIHSKKFPPILRNYLRFKRNGISSCNCNQVIQFHLSFVNQQYCACFANKGSSNRIVD